MKKILFILFLCILFLTSFAQETTYYTSFGEHVEAQINIYDSGKENNNKSTIIGKLANELANKLNNKDKKIYLIFRDGEHGKPEYEIYYEFKETETITVSLDDPDSSSKKHETLILYIRKLNNYNITEVLKILEYGLLNFDSIKAGNPYSISKILDQAVSKNIKELLALKTYRQPLNPSCWAIDYDNDCTENKGNIEERGLTYYFQNNKYHIITINPETERLVLDDIYQFEDFPSYHGHGIIFDTDTTFYYIKNNSHQIVDKYMDKVTVKRHTIQDTGRRLNRSYKVSQLGDRIFICFTNSSSRMKTLNHRFWERYLIYFTKKDILIQDLDARMNYDPDWGI